MSTTRRESNAVSSPRGTLAASWDKLLFLVSAAIVAYATGIATGHFHLPPYDALSELWGAGLDWQKNWRAKLGIEPSPHLSVGRHQGAGVVQRIEGKLSPGVTLVEGLFDGRVGLRLLDDQGNALHTWDALYSEISPKLELTRTEDIPTNDWETMVHGSALYPDGDVLFNLPGLALVRMNACEDVEWALPFPTHHSIHIADDGNIWTLGARNYDQAVAKFPGLRPEFRDDLVLEVSPAGQILREMSSPRSLLRE